VITANARAKVNLFLQVTGKRTDGYHLLESLVVFADRGDRITVQEAEDLTLKVSGPFSTAIDSTEENLVIKAAQKLKSESGIDKGARISLEKNLPVAAGIGGGSADAAATLKSLNTLWNIGFSEDRLSQIGLSLGADIPACLYGRPAIMSGIGEHISGIVDFPEFYILLVNEGSSLATKDVFKRLKSTKKTPPSVDFNGLTVRELFTALRSMPNDLAAPALQIVPAIGTVLAMIREQKGCDLARMSGSGATCFGLFAEGDAARKAAKAIQAKHPGWWVQSMAVGP
jgi:4-diphosphocytidyl-2-C-methyl-D-erythritol kinase